MTAAVRKHLRGVAATLFVGVVTALVLLWKPARSLALLVPSLAGFVEVRPNVWVEHGMPTDDRDAVVEAVSAARVRVRDFYSVQVGRPVVLACSTMSCFRRCGGVGHGTTYFGSRVLLGPAALKPVKVTHEFSHVELAARVGAGRVLLRVPRWFDEGLAVLVSDDPAFEEAKWAAATNGGATAPDLRRLVTLRSWLNMTKLDGQLSYGTARHEVARWYTCAGRPGIERLVTMLRDGYSFDQAYAAAR